MSDQFDSSRAANLETDERRDVVRPLELLVVAGAAPGMVCADLGSGTGFFVRPLAGLVGPSGVVYSVDESREMLAFQRRTLQEEGMVNVHLVVAPVEQVPLPSGILDLCVCSFVLHELANRAALFAEMGRLVQPQGRALLVDWHAIEPPPGPALAKRVPRDVAIRGALAAGFRIIAEIERHPQHYALVLGKAR